MWSMPPSLRLSQVCSTYATTSFHLRCASIGALADPSSFDIAQYLLEDGLDPQIMQQQDIICAGHESWVLSVACHPSGSSFATGSSDAKVKLWDLQTRTCAQTLSDHTDQVCPHCPGCHILSACKEKYVHSCRLWSLAGTGLLWKSDIVVGLRFIVCRFGVLHGRQMAAG
jgi:WD40 repeat protein